MRRIAYALCCALLILPAFADQPRPSLPSWFPPPNGLYEVNRLTYAAYDEFPLHADRNQVTELQRNNGGYALAHGKVWRFEMKNPKPDAWAAAAEQLLKQGFHFVHGDMKSVKGSAAFAKGEGDHATYVAFWQCCNSVAIVETAPNPFHVTLKAPTTASEAIGAKDAIPYLPPIDGGVMTSGHEFTERMSVVPDCKAEPEPFGSGGTWRRYAGPPALSDYAVQQTYRSALEAAGWQQICERGSHGLEAHFAKNGRDIWVHISPHVGEKTFEYEVTTADAGAGLKAELKKNCKASLYGVNFDFDKATLRPDAEPALNQLLSVLKDEPKLVVEIGGHTDNVGKSDYNLKLSDQRAAAVRQWLVARGIAAPRLTSHGYGDTQPLVPNSTDENRAKNRRVEVKRTDCR